MTSEAAATAKRVNPAPGKRSRARRWLFLGAALGLLNAALTFHNVWPTLGVRWRAELSVELAALVLFLAVWSAWIGKPSRRMLGLLSSIYVLFTLGRYGDVVAPALYGREVNLYWDAQHVASLVGMLTRVASAWAIAGVVIGSLVVLTLLYVTARRSIGEIAEALQRNSTRTALGFSGALLLSWFTAQALSERFPRYPQFSIPVSKTYATQISRVLDTFANSRAVQSLPPSPSMSSDFSALAGADVLLVFLESYGSSTFDRPEFALALQPVRQRLAAAIGDTRRAVVSGFVESPTFGGGSWLAHLSLLSGIEVRDPNRYALLMTQKRETMASILAAAGYRSIAVMPGLSRPWPEGSFYRFDDIYGAGKLDYHGPEFGWWRIPDQYALAKLDALEIKPQPRKPLFVFFPTISTHMPFRPTPPLQSNWSRILSRQPFDEAPLQEALTRKPEWTDLGKGYVGSIAYALDSIAGFLRERADGNFVMIVLGDHQPAASVSGEGASWDVPVHVISNSQEILASLQAEGFSPGLEPATRQAIAPMYQLGPMLMSAFGSPAKEPTEVPSP